MSSKASVYELYLAPKIIRQALFWILSYLCMETSPLSLVFKLIKVGILATILSTLMNNPLFEIKGLININEATKQAKQIQSNIFTSSDGGSWNSSNLSELFPQCASHG